MKKQIAVLCNNMRFALIGTMTVATVIVPINAKRMLLHNTAICFFIWFSFNQVVCFFLYAYRRPHEIHCNLSVPLQKCNLHLNHLGDRVPRASCATTNAKPEGRRLLRCVPSLGDVFFTFKARRVFRLSVNSSSLGTCRMCLSSDR